MGSLGFLPICITMKVPFPFLVSASLVSTIPLSAGDVVDLSLQGNLSTDHWDPSSISAASNPGYPSALSFSQNWPAPIQSPYGSDAYLNKTGNGATGAPIPSGGSIYFVSFANLTNTNGGSLAVFDDTPLPNLKTVAFQLEIGGANGYDLHNNNLAQPANLSSVVLHYTTTSGSGSLTASSPTLLDRFYTFAIDMPVGANGENLPVDVFNRLYGLQWDLSHITDPITSFRIEFKAVEHAQIYHLRVDQSDHGYGTTSVFPAESVWTGLASDAHWETPANWQSGSVPASNANIRFASGAGADLTSDPSHKSITFSGSEPFVLSSAEDHPLTLTSGINATSATEISHEITAPLQLTKYNLFELAGNNTLAISSSIEGTGFYKQGPGSLRLTGNNRFDATIPSFRQNGLIISGGDNTFSGSNTFEGIPSATFNIRPDTTVRLTGPTPPLDPKFAVNLLGSTSRLVLGDESSPVSQTVLSLAGSVASVPITGSQVIGGSPDISTLTLSSSSGISIFAGDIGGTGLHENNLSIVKSGAGLQILSGNLSHTGDTRIRGGTLAMDPTGRSIELSGGVLALQGTDLTTTLGRGADGVFFTGSGGFAANGLPGTSSSDPLALHTLTLNGGAALSWNSSDFLKDGEKLMLSAAGTNRTLVFTNPLILGNVTRHIEVGDGLQETDARLSSPITGSADIIKTGSGLLELSAENTTSGTIHLHAGILAIAGQNGAYPGSLNAGPGTFLRLSNSSGASRDHRLSATSSINLSGAFLTFTSVPTGNTESVSTLTIGQGYNTISTSRASVGSSTTITFPNLVRVPSSVVNFSGASVGVDARNQVLFTQPPALTNELIGGGALTGNEFATYGPNGVTAFTAYSTAAESAWTPTDNVKLTAGAATSPTATLTADRTIHSLRLIGATAGSFGNVLELGGNTFSVRSGGILINSGADTRTNKIRNGTLTAPGELLFTSNGITEVSAAIADASPSSPLTLVKSGSQILSLLGPASYTGPTIVNQGVLRLSADSSLASSLVELKHGSTFRVIDFPAGYEISSTRTLTGIGTVDGSILNSGTIAPTPSAQTPLTVSGNASFAAGSILRISVTPSSDLPLSSSLKVAGSLSIAPGAKLRITTDHSTDFWNQPRNFTVVTAGSFAGDYASASPFTIESELTGGSWQIIYHESSISIGWTPLTPLQQWRQDKFGTSENSAHAADDADPDGDGIANLIEYALGTDPELYAPADAPAFDAASGFTFEVPANPPSDLTYEVQISTDLVSWKVLSTLTQGGDWEWNGEGTSTISLIPGPTRTRVTIADDEPATPPERRFMRLKVTY